MSGAGATIRHCAPAWKPPEERALSQQPHTPIRRISRTPTVWIILGTVLFLTVLSLMSRGQPGQELSFSQFQQDVSAGEVASAKILEGDQVVTGDLKDGAG